MGKIFKGDGGSMVSRGAVSVVSEDKAHPLAGDPQAPVTHYEKAPYLVRRQKITTPGSNWGRYRYTYSD